MVKISTGTQFPLQTASFEERAKQAADVLSPLFDDLNQKWWAVEAKLRSMLPPRHAWASYKQCDDDDNQPQGSIHACLGLVKYRGDWRLCRGSYYDLHECGPSSWKPIVECSVEERVEAVDGIENLRESILSAAEESIPTIKEAAAKLAATLERI